MFLNPQTLLDKKIVTCSLPELKLEEHVQQNGIDINCNSIFEFGEGMLTVTKDKTDKLPLRQVTPSDVYFKNGSNEGWLLEKHVAYSFDSSFYVEIPEGMCGWIIGRSSFNRFGILVRSALYDSGFKGYVGGTIYCFNHVKIEKDARIAQLVLCSAENAALYNGQYQAKQ